MKKYVYVTICMYVTFRRTVRKADVFLNLKGKQKMCIVKNRIMQFIEKNIYTLNL